MLPYSLQTAHVTIVKVGSILDFEPVVTTSKGKSILDLAMESSELETLQRRQCDAILKYGCCLAHAEEYYASPTWKLTNKLYLYVPGIMTIII